MPRKRAPARLWFDKRRGQYVIRHGSRFLRCSTAELGEAERQLAAYIGASHVPQRGSDPLISDVLLVYWKEHLSQTATGDDSRYRIEHLARGWGASHVSGITPGNCRAYGNDIASTSSARKNLECLRAAIRYWHRHYGPLAVVPAITMPPKSAPRERWLTRSEAARLLWAARRTEHLKRFILIGLYTGSRTKNILGLKWEQVDLSSAVLSRRAAGESEAGKKRSPPVRLGRRILSHLRRWRLQDAVSEYVVHFEGRPVARVNKANGAFRGAATRAGLRMVTPHTLRHTAATWLMQRGVGIWEAAGFLGMSPEVLTKRYGHHSPDYQKDAAEALSRK